MSTIRRKGNVVRELDDPLEGFGRDLFRRRVDERMASSSSPGAEISAPDEGVPEPVHVS